MSLPNPTELRRRSRESLSRADGHQRLVLISTGASALLALAVSALNMLLDNGIATTGGLAGLGLRSILSTVQSMLGLITALLLPFWTLGYTAVTLKLAKNQPANAGDLLLGFRHFFPALRLFLLTELLYIALAIVSINLGSMVLSFTPLSNGLYEIMMPVLMEGSDPTAIDPEMLLQAMTPILIGCAVIFAIMAIPLSYRIRMAQLALLENPKAGARRALFSSFRMMKGNCMALFRLDLSFWWFYGLDVLLAAFAYGDLLLPRLGIETNATLAYFAFYVVSLGLQLVLYWKAKNPVSVSYAHAYLTLRNPENEVMEN